MDINTVNSEVALGDLVTINVGAVIGTTRFEDGRVTYLVQYDRKGQTVQDWFNADEITGLGFDDE